MIARPRLAWRPRRRARPVSPLRTPWSREASSSPPGPPSGGSANPYSRSAMRSQKSASSPDSPSRFSKACLTASRWRSFTRLRPPARGRPSCLRSIGARGDRASWHAGYAVGQGERECVAQMLRSHFVTPMAMRTTPVGTRMNVVGQTARPTPIASRPQASQRQGNIHSMTIRRRTMCR